MIKKWLYFIICFCLLVSYACASEEDKLIEATKNGNIELISDLLQKGVNVNCRDETGQSPLHHACYLGYFDIAKLLIENDAEINMKVSDMQLTPLHAATSNGNPELVALLVENGADVHAKDSKGATPLPMACWVGAFDTVKYLVSKGATLDTKTNYGATPLHFACQSSSLELVQFLIDSGCNVNLQSMNGVTPLHLAVALGNLPIVNELLKYGASQNFRLKYNSEQYYCLKAPPMEDDAVMKIDLFKGQSALDIATARGHIEIVNTLKSSEDIKNPDVVAAIRLLLTDESKTTKENLAAALNKGKFIALVVPDHLSFSGPEYEGKLYIKSKDKKAKLKISVDAIEIENKYLDLFTDEMAIKMCPDIPPVKRSILSASEAWELVLRSEYNIGVMINPCMGSLPLGRDQVEYLHNKLNEK